MNLKTICILAGALLILGIIPTWPYGYYIFLRWAIFASSLFVVYGFYNSKITGWALVFAAIAYLFNPIIPVYLSRAVWTPIDLISAVLFFIAAYSTKAKGTR